jgi:ribose transport system ATP-binding protein
MEQNDRAEVLAIYELTKTFGDTRALDRVQFNVYAGEVHCLVGENGAGKSTLIKILSGAERPDQGRIIAFGQEYSRLTPAQSLELGIATIYQDIELVTSLTVADNIFLGHEIKTAFGLVDYRAQNREARELMDSMNINIPATALVERLSPAQQQTLQIVKALHIKARIMIMDEPTSSLGVEETKALMDLVRGLTAQKIAVIYISHYLQEIFEIGDRVSVLKDGRLVATFDVSTTDLGTITKSMLGRERSLVDQQRQPRTEDVVLQVRSLSKQGFFEKVSFDLYRGEILGFGGVVGAGRSELMNVIFGAERRDSGDIILNGRSINPDSPRAAIAQGLAMIPEDRKVLGLFELRSVLENIAVVSNETGGLFLNHGRERTMVKELIDRLHLVTSGFDQPVGFLSGGNQQKAIFARWLLCSAVVLILDEPTKGVDIGAKEELYRLVLELAKQGKSILMVSSDISELLAMSDRIAVMRDGALVTIANPKSVTEQDLLNAFLGIDQEGRATHA